MHVSVVIPVFKTEQFILPLHERLSAVLQEISGDYEIIFVDDCSPDQSWNSLRALVERDHHVGAIRLAQNVGQHAAIAAGMSRAQGDWNCVMDCDLQDPPETVLELYAKAANGAEIVMSRRINRHHDIGRRLGSFAFRHLLKAVRGNDLTAGYGMLSMINSRARELYCTRPERRHCYLQILNSVPRLTRAAISYKGQPRRSGRSSYTLRRLWRMALRSLLSKPIDWNNGQTVASDQIFIVAEEFRNKSRAVPALPRLVPRLTQTSCV
jgi:dolichol-phosphate mannosyltransferase